jgi:hypothetical protein
MPIKIQVADSKLRQIPFDAFMGPLLGPLLGGGNLKLYNCNATTNRQAWEERQANSDRHHLLT